MIDGVMVPQALELLLCAALCAIVPCVNPSVVCAAHRLGPFAWSSSNARTRPVGGMVIRVHCLTLHEFVCLPRLERA